MAYISRDLGRIDIEYDYEKDLGINIDSIRYTDWRTEEAYSYFKKISFNAVFSPIPFTPGILSDASPISAFTSISFSGVNPYSSLIL